MSPTANRLAASILALGAWSPTVAAQVGTAPTSAPTRAKVLGIVQGESAKAWADARVFLLSRPVADDETVGSPDLLETRTDARGRFRVDVLRNRRYTVWARTDPHPDGRFRITGVAEAVLAGPPITLRGEPGPPLRRVEVSVQGLGAWGHRGPFTFHLVSATDNLHLVELHPEDLELIRLPVMPGRQQRLEIRDRNGVPICAARELPCAGREPAPTVVRVPAPIKTRFCAHGPDARPVVGGRVLLQLRRTQRVVGKTGADGYVEIELPDPEHPNAPRVFLLDAPGFALWLFQPGRDDAALLASIPGGATRRPHWWVRPSPGRETRGRVVAHRGGLLQQVQVIAQMPLWVAEGASTTTRLRIEIGEGGRFRLPGQRDAWSSVHLVLTAPARLGPEFAGAHGIVPCVVPPRDEGAAPLVIRLADIRPIDICVEDPDGGPAAGARIDFLTSPRVHPLPNDALRTGPTGRIRVGLLAGVPLTVLVRDAPATGVCSIATGVWTLAPPSAGTGVTRLTLRLRPPLTVSGTLEDPAGRPASGWVRGLTGYRDDLAERDNATRRSRIADGVFSAAVCDVATRSQLALMCMPLNHAVQADARGHFVLPVPAMPMAWRLTGSTGRFSYSAGAGLPMVHTGSGSVSGVKLEFR